MGTWVRGAWRALRSWAGANPYAANIATSALVFSTGDVLCQVVERRLPAAPLAEGERDATAGSASHGPAANGAAATTAAAAAAGAEALSTEMDGGGGGGGDGGGERANESKERYDVPRALRATAYGTGISVWLQAWWGFLQTSANALVPAARFPKMANVLFVVALDQAIGASILNAGYFFTVSWLSDFNAARAAQRVRDCWGPQMQLHLSFWPWFSIALFHSVSALSSRLLIRNVVFAAWSGTMSYRNNQAERRRKHHAPPHIEQHHVQCA